MTDIQNLTLEQMEAIYQEVNRRKCHEYYAKNAEQERAKRLERYYKSLEGKERRPRGKPRKTQWIPKMRLKSKDLTKIHRKQVFDRGT